MSAALYLRDSDNTPHWSDDVVKTRNYKMLREKMAEKSLQCRKNGTFNMRVGAVLASTQVAGHYAINNRLPQLCRLPHQDFVLYRQQSRHHHANMNQVLRRGLIFAFVIFHILYLPTAYLLSQ